MQTTNPLGLFQKIGIQGSLSLEYSNNWNKKDI
jgi:hypothetical protein